jgi:hypothetical protein
MMVDVQTIGVLVTAASVSVAAIYYAFTLRINLKNQELGLKAQQQTLETRQAQMFMNIYEKHSSAEFGKAWEKTVFTPWRTWEEFSKLWEDPEFNEAAILIGTTYDGLGVLVKEGLLDIRLVALLMCGRVRQYGEKILPILDDGRKAMGFRRWLSEAEYLYRELIMYVEVHPELDTRVERVPHAHALYEK